MRTTIVALFCALAVVLAPAAFAHGDYANKAAGKKLARQLQSEHGIAQSTTLKLLGNARYQPDIIAKMEKPAEKTLTWAKYRPIFVQEDRARQGADFIGGHRKAFDDAEKKYGVPIYIIAAILGVETRYGRFVGNDRVLDALATLAFDYPPRSEFFTRELGKFITLCVQEKLQCTKDIGSYAGAMGVPQFMPSSYAAYAVDGNDNGRRDLWKEPADIVFSVANYLAENGWQRGKGIVQPARLENPDAIDQIKTSKRHTHYTWEQLQQLGVRVNHPPAASTRVGLLQFTGPHGPEYWLAEHNFFVITTYNTSPLYAMAVDQLAMEIRAFTRPREDR